LTIIRAWSRVGHGQAVDMAMPWIHTEAYLLLGDDYIVRDSRWVDHLKTELLDKPEVGYLRSAHWPCGVCQNPGTGKWQIQQARFSSHFFAIKKAVAEELGIRWAGYFVNCDFKIDQHYVDANVPYEDQLLAIQHGCGPVAELNYGELIADTGAWPRKLLEVAGVQGGIMDSDTFVLQNRDLSWHLDKDALWQLYADIKKVPEYHELYMRYQSEHRTADILADYKKAPIDPNMKVLVAVCVYDRFREIINWLRAWRNANQYGCKLAVVHSWEDEAPNQSLVDVIQQFAPDFDFYLPRFNRGMDIGACKELADDPRVGEWDALLWFTDDCLPMNKDFLVPFLTALSNKNVGLAGAFPEVSYIRTIAFGIKKEAMKKLPWINDGDICTRQHCLQMESQLQRQVRDLGYEAIPLLPQPGNENYIHWSHFTDWIWDADSTNELDMWAKFEEQFPAEDRIVGSLDEIKTYKVKYGSRKKEMRWNDETLKQILREKGLP